MDDYIFPPIPLKRGGPRRILYTDGSVKDFYGSALSPRNLRDTARGIRHVGMGGAEIRRQLRNEKLLLAA